MPARRPVFWRNLPAELIVGRGFSAKQPLTCQRPWQHYLMNLLQRSVRGMLSLKNEIAVIVYELLYCITVCIDCEGR